MLRNILLGAGIFAAILSILIFSGKLPIGSNKTPAAQGDVVMWGTVPEVGMNPIIQSYNNQAKTYRITYKEVNEDVFSQRLLEALASGTGPDMIIAPHQIILSQISRIYPFPLTSLPEKSFKDTYVDGASILFNPAGALALPVSIEPMVLFYNRSLFSKHGFVDMPSCQGTASQSNAGAPNYVCWDQITNIVPALTSIDLKNNFLESGIALGAPNTPYAKDILMSIVTQLGQTPVFKDSNSLISVLANNPVKEGGDVLPLSTATRFFSQFADPTKNTYSWNQFSGNADDMFVAEKLAMYIGYSGEYDSLRARNQKGDFGMTYFPQTKGYNTFTTGAKIYGVATLLNSKNPVTALTVESVFAGSGVSPSIATAIGGVPALRSYLTTPGLNEVVVRSVLVARAWYDAFPKESSSYVSTMLSDILSNRYSLSDAVSVFAARLQDLYTKR